MHPCATLFFHMPGLAVALSVLAGCVGIIIFPRAIVAALCFLFPEIIWRDGSRRTFALTFDDGPDPEFTPAILRILDRYHAKATFFLVGSRAALYPEIVNRIRAEGHEIANHSMTWRRTLAFSTKEFEHDLFEAEAALDLTGRKWFRPAGMWIRPAQLKTLRELGYECVLGSAYAFDPYRPPARWIVRMITHQLAPGLIIVLHDSGGNRSNTVAALPAIIETAVSRGLNAVTLSELLVD